MIFRLSCLLLVYIICLRVTIMASIFALEDRRKAISSTDGENLWKNKNTSCFGTYKTLTKDSTLNLQMTHIAVGETKGIDKGNNTEKKEKEKMDRKSEKIFNDDMNLTVYEEEMKNYKGKKLDSIALLIAEGKPIESNSNEMMPYIVSLRSWTDVHLCGGSIINKRWVLSAAHCWVPRFGFQVVAGSVFRKKHRSMRRFKVAIMILHHRYNKIKKIFDISLLKMKQSFTFNTHIQPVIFGVLPLDYNRHIMVSGWGYESFPSQMKIENSGRLNIAYSKLILDDDCEYDDKFCSVSKLAQGDSGGPLISEGKQVGVVSISVQERYDANTNLSNYYKWMSDTIIFFNKRKTPVKNPNVKYAP